MIHSASVTAAAGALLYVCHSGCRGSKHPAGSHVACCRAIWHVHMYIEYLMSVHPGDVTGSVHLLAASDDFSALTVTARVSCGSGACLILHADVHHSVSHSALHPGRSTYAACVKLQMSATQPDKYGTGARQWQPSCC